MTKQDWIEAVARQLTKTMPDQYPDSFATFMAEQYAVEGGYDNFIAGKYSDNLLYDPEAVVQNAQKEEKS